LSTGQSAQLKPAAPYLPAGQFAQWLAFNLSVMQYWPTAIVQ
jgi:hypothetical protein